MVHVNKMGTCDSATVREHSASPEGTDPKYISPHVREHPLSRTLCPPPRRNQEPLMLLFAGHPPTNCNIQPEGPDLRYQV